MSLASDVNSIIKIKKIKAGLPSLPVQTGIASKKGLGANEPGITIVLTPPLTYKALTYDDSQDVVFLDISSVEQTLKTVKTAVIIDAYGNEYPIDTIIFEPPA